jgi:hypothetical protein
MCLWRETKGPHVERVVVLDTIWNPRPEMGWSLRWILKLDTQVGRGLAPTGGQGRHQGRSGRDGREGTSEPPKTEIGVPPLRPRRAVGAGPRGDVTSVSSLLSRTGTSTSSVTGDLKDGLGIAVSKRTFRRFRELLGSAPWKDLADGGSHTTEARR